MRGIVKSLSGQSTVPDVNVVEEAVAAGSNAQLALRVGIHLGVPGTDESGTYGIRIWYANCLLTSNDSRTYYKSSYLWQ